jgi:Zn-dependent metalloprotease
MKTNCLRVNPRPVLGMIALIFVAISYGQQPVRGPDPTMDGPGPSEVATTDAEKAATLAIMTDHLSNKFGIDASKEFKGAVMVKDNKNNWHASLDQYYNGVKVRGGHFNMVVKDGAVKDGSPSDPTVTGPGASALSHGTYLDHDVDTKPKITAGHAIAIAEKLLRDEVERGGGRQLTNGAGKTSLLVDNGKKPSTAGLEIHPGGGPGKRKLTYHVSAEDHSASGPVQLEAWVDQEGNIVEVYNNAQTNCQAGRGATFYQGYQGLGYGINYFNVAYWPAANAYVLNDTCLHVGAFDMYGSTSATYQASVSGCCGPYFGNTTLGDRNSSNSDAYLATVQTFSFMYWVLGRNFVDGSGGPKVYGAVDGTGGLISARNHYGVKYNNAFWDGQKMNLGDGDGSTFRSFATLDIIGHEWHHGLTQYTAGLNYSGESGALNEAFSDIYGAMTERYWYGESANTWKIGEGAYTPATAGDALRYMNAPWLGGQPWNYQSRYTGTADNGGVHTNSGIMNFAFYLLAKGGCGYNCVSGIGADAATQIFYRAERYYMIPTDGFYWVRYCTLWAAGDLYGYGSNAYYQVWNAWNAVGAPY